MPTQNTPSCAYGRIQYTFQWTSHAKLKLQRATATSTPIVIKVFGATICHQKATLQAIPEYLSEFRVFCATLNYIH